MDEISDDAALELAMDSVSDYTRMHAVAAISVLAENHALSLATRSSKSVVDFDKTTNSLPEKRGVSAALVQKLEELLNDAVARVCVPSAVTLYSLSKETDKAEEVLHSALAEDVDVCERWAAVQCLACAGQVSADVIEQLLPHLMDSLSPNKQARASLLLARASHQTVRTPNRIRQVDASPFYAEFGSLHGC